jgi:mRNA-degrading endonuclease toxin of MazEF toxin-antitoxin module
MKRGDLVIAQFPHAAGTPPKSRPVLVVQADFYNQRINNVLVAAVTTNLTRRGDPAHCFVDVATVEGKLSGLSRASLISCLNLAVLPKTDLGQKIGELSAHLMSQIDDCLKTALGMA